MTYLPVCECSDDVGCATAEHILQDEGLWIHAFRCVPLFTTLPTSPLRPRFLRSKAISRSFSLNILASSGRLGRMIIAHIPRRIVGMPSMMNKSFQFARAVCACWIPNAMSPLKAPETAEKLCQHPVRIPISSRV